MRHGHHDRERPRRIAASAVGADRRSSDGHPPAALTAEPDVVVRLIQDDEDGLRASGLTPGGRFAHGWLRERRPVHALVRQWAGAAEVRILRDEVLRVRRVAEHAIDTLRAGGKELEAGRLRRELNGR